MSRVRNATIALIALLALTLALARSGLATGDADPLAPLPGTLDEMLASALARNPEILVEEARVREAQASLNQARLAVTQRVVQLHFEREEQERVLAQQGKELERHRVLFNAGTASEGEIRQAEILFAQSEGALARIEAQIRYAMGHGGSLPDSGLLADPRPGAVRETAVEEDFDFPEPAPIPDPVARILDGIQVQVEYTDIPLKEVCAQLTELSGLDILLGPSLRDEDLMVTLRLRGKVSLRKTLHALADFTDVRFIVREWGLLVVWNGEVPEAAPVIPTGR